VSSLPLNSLRNRGNVLFILFYVFYRYLLENPVEGLRTRLCGAKRVISLGIVVLSRCDSV